jgi:hypothetical protein
MNVKRAPITTFCVVLALVFYSLDLRHLEWAAAAAATLPDAVVLKLPGFLCTCSLLLGFAFYFLFERFNGTHHLCPAQAVAHLPLWDELKTARTLPPPLYTLHLCGLALTTELSSSP